MQFVMFLIHCFYAKVNEEPPTHAEDVPSACPSKEMESRLHKLHVRRNSIPIIQKQVRRQIFVWFELF